MDDKKLNPKLVEYLQKLSLEEIEKIKSESTDEAFVKEVVYTLKMVPKLK